MNKTRILKRIFAILLVTVMAMAVIALPISAIPEYRAGENEVSEAYKGGKYYKNLMSVSLTGDGATDALAVALSQLGYSEANSIDTVSGTNKGSSNFTEFYYNFGKATESWSIEWDAAFCSWVLYQAGVSSQSSMSDRCGNHKGDINYIWREIDSKQWAEQLIAVGLYSTADSEYKPMSGDLIFFKHSGKVRNVGFVVWYDESTNTVYTVEGNTNSGSGLDGDGGGVYYKSYSLSSPSIHGYGKLPYQRNDALKVDYSGRNQTAGLYIAKADFWVSLPHGGELTVKIPQYDMFKVTAFDGQYAIIEYGDGRYYGSLNSNTLQMTAYDTHIHHYQEGKDGTHHYRVCECGEKINSAEHSYVLEGKDENCHVAKCSCGYEKDTVAHIFELVVDADTHKLVCECGYVKADSQTPHKYEILDSDAMNHFYRCECGEIGEETVEAHTVTKNFNSEEHFDACVKCARVFEGTQVAHSYDISTQFNVCECGYDRSNVSDEHVWVIEYSADKHYQKCADCGEIRFGTESAHVFDTYSNEGAYHARKCVCGYVDKSSKADHVYNGFGCPDGETTIHMQTCKCGAFLEGSEEAHYYNTLVSDENGHWLECVCGLKGEIEAHTKVDGVCTECMHHTHTYAHDESGHWMSCADSDKALAEHTFKNGECTVCGYSPDAVCEHTVENGSCTKCGYHEHSYNHNTEGHWTVCGCPTSKLELNAHVMNGNKCEICGYNAKQNVMHKLVDGTCTECGYHEHVYAFDISGHRAICDCYLGGRMESHSLKDGRCTHCGYDSKTPVKESDDEKVKTLYSGDPVKGVSPSGCSSVVGTASAVLGVLVMLGCGVVFKKKGDR